jgi:hypothetical protein
MDCLVLLQSKLQTDIATSTMELEYNALSMAMQDVLPLKHLTKELIRALGQSNIKPATFHKTLRTIVHKDNTGAL